MRIKFLKDHVNNVEGDETDVDNSLGNYLVAVGAAKQVKSKEKKEIAETKEKKEEFAGKEKAESKSKK